MLEKGNILVGNGKHIVKKKHVGKGKYIGRKRKHIEKNVGKRKK